MPRARTTVIVIACAGLLLHAWTAVVEAEGGPGLFALGLFAWSSLPYLACLLIALPRWGRPWLGVCGAAAALCVDALTWYSVFVAPDGSTAALGLLVVPLVNLIVVVPTAVLLGFLLERWRSAR